MSCPHCAHPNPDPDGWERCIFCNRPLDAEHRAVVAWRCKECDHLNCSGQVICDGCGVSIDD